MQRHAVLMYLAFIKKTQTAPPIPGGALLLGLGDSGDIYVQML